MPKLDAISSEGYSPELIELIEAAPIPGIGDGPHCSETASRIGTVVKNDGLKGSLEESGLWLLAGELDRSHTISQDQSSAEGSFWHGIMHRREGDFGNSKYWFRRVGRHNVHDELAKLIDGKASELNSGVPVASLTSPTSLPDALVDLCQSVTSGANGLTADAEKICWWEWQLLFAACS